MAKGKLLDSSWPSLRVLSRFPCVFLVGGHEWLSGLAVTGVDIFGMWPAFPKQTVGVGVGVGVWVGVVLVCTGYT